MAHDLPDRDRLLWVSGSDNRTVCLQVTVEATGEHS